MIIIGSLIMAIITQFLIYLFLSLVTLGIYGIFIKWKFKERDYVICNGIIFFLNTLFSIRIFITQETLYLPIIYSILTIYIFFVFRRTINKYGDPFFISFSDAINNEKEYFKGLFQNQGENDPISKIYNNGIKNHKVVPSVNFRNILTKDERKLKMPRQTNNDESFGTNIRQRILISIVLRAFLYCLASFVVIYYSLIILRRLVLDYLVPSTVEELMAISRTDYYKLMLSLNSFLYTVLSGHNWIFLLSFSFLFIWIYTSKTKVSFICPHCLKTILFRNISNIHCPLCDTGGHSRFEILLYCSSCRQSMDYFDCPHCQHSIDIKEKYDHQYLLNKRREVTRMRPSYLTGLRELYNRKKRLPQFICKHCLKSLITKNYNLICPHCKAIYIVTDNRTQVQIGDVKIKNYRYVGDESTMEKVLFDSCIQCGGMIEVIECYHNDCKKDIDLLEEYNEAELLKRRYGKD